MEKPRLRLGELLIDSGLLTKEKLEQALTIQRQRHLRLGTILLQEGLVSEANLMQALSRHLSIPWVSINLIDIPENVLNLVPANVAEEFFLIPIYIRTERGGNRALYVAMNDPSDDDAMRFVQASSGMTVRPMIAGPTDIATAIRYYYYDEEVVPPPAPSNPPPPPAEVEEELMDMSDELEMDSIMPPPMEEEEDSRPEDSRPEDSRPEDSKPEAADEPEPEDAPEEVSSASAPPTLKERPKDLFEDKTSAQREAERRIYGVGRKKARGFALTLLDGTTLSFNANKKASSSSSGTLSKEDLLAGLKAAAEGTPLDDFLPAEKWESYVSAMLQLLFKKHLLMYDEFIEILEQIEKKK